MRGRRASLHTLFVGEHLGAWRAQGRTTWSEGGQGCSTRRSAPRGRRRWMSKAKPRRNLHALSRRSCGFHLGFGLVQLGADTFAVWRRPRLRGDPLAGRASHGHCGASTAYNLCQDIYDVYWCCLRRVSVMSAPSDGAFLSGRGGGGRWPRPPPPRAARAYALGVPVVLGAAVSSGGPKAPPRPPNPKRLPPGPTS
jgi:hypothetical protein